MRKKMQFTCVGLLILAGSIAFAKEIPTLVIATGPAGSNNNKMFKKLGKVCSNVAYLKEITPNQHDSLKMLIPNTFNIPSIKKGPVDLSFISLDQFIEYSESQSIKKEKKENIKILLPIHKEKIILLTEKYEKKSFAEINKMGSVRRTITTSKFLKKYLDASYEEINFQSTEKALDKLNNKEIDGLLLIQEEKADWAKDLSKFSISSIPYKGKIRDIYDQTLVYIKDVTKRPASALFSQNLLVTRNYLDKKPKNLRLKYKKCILDNSKKTGLIQEKKKEGINVNELYPEFIYR